jgi:signal transduction histidine kinase
MLRRQMKYFGASTAEAPQDWAGFLEAVDAAYRQSDKDRLMLERSLELTSDELLAANAELQVINQGLEARVQSRSQELEQSIAALQQSEQTLRLQNSHLTALHRVSLSLLQRRTVSEVLSSILDEAGELLDAETGYISLLEGPTNTVVAVRGSVGKILGRKLDIWSDNRAAHQISISRQPMTIKSYQKWPDRNKDLDEYHLNALAGAPITIGENIRGVLILVREERTDEFDDHAAHALTLFAQLAAIAIDNAELYSSLTDELDYRLQIEQNLRRQERSLRRQNKYLKVLQQTTIDWLNSPDPERVLQRVLERTVGLLDAISGQIWLIDGDDAVLQAAFGSIANAPNDRVEYLTTAGLEFEVLRSREPALMDLDRTEGLDQSVKSPLSDCGTMAVPILSGGRLFGSIGLAHGDSGRSFDASQLGHLHMIAQLIALGLQNMDLYTDLQIELSVRREAETNLKVAYTELEQQALDLARSNADLEQFASAASHDLQEPLRIIVTYSQLLERSSRHELDSDAMEYLAFIKNGGKRMQALIKGLLNYSRLGREGETPETISSKQVVLETVKNIDLLLLENSGQITLGDLPRIQGNALLLSQLFQNLIANAIKFRRKADPIIHIAAKPRSESAESDCVEWQFSVQDNGIGIPNDQHGQLFGLFKRLHLDGNYQGTGIGLATCKRIVEWHGGRIWLESELGQGTTVMFTLQGPALDNA